MSHSINGECDMMRQLIQQSRNKLNKIEDQLNREDFYSVRVEELIEQHREVHTRLAERLRDIEKRLNLT